MVDRSTRCISQVFGFLKDVESCENCEINTTNDFEGNITSDSKSNLIKKSVSDTKIFKQPVQHQPQIERKCICHLKKPLPENARIDINLVKTQENGGAQFENGINGEICICEEKTVVEGVDGKVIERREGEMNKENQSCEKNIGCQGNSTNGNGPWTESEDDVLMRPKSERKTPDGRSNTQVVSEMFRFLNTGSVSVDEDTGSTTPIQKLCLLIEHGENENNDASENSIPKCGTDNETPAHTGIQTEESICEQQSILCKNESNVCEEIISREKDKITDQESVTVPSVGKEERHDDQASDTRHEKIGHKWDRKNISGIENNIDCVSQIVIEPKAGTSSEAGSEKPQENHGNGETLCDEVFENKELSLDERGTKTDSSPDVVKRRKHSSRKTESDDHSDDSSDEDTGIYAESYRNSTWIRLDEDGELNSTKSASLPTRKKSDPNIDVRVSCASMSDDVFADGRGSPQVRTHKRSDSSTTTLSETEFKRQYTSRRKCLIQRDDSQQEYHRLSARYYDEERILVIQKEEGEVDQDFGLHVLDCQPAYITSVDPGSPAARAGAQEGQILISVNGVNVLEAGHDEIVGLMQQDPSVIKLEVAYSDFQPIRDLQASVMSGYMFKLGNSALMRTWKKRYFILRQDNCLYYYKTEQAQIPLGAVPLAGYSISRYIDTNKDFCFKADKYGARSYYFMTDSRDEMTKWVGKLTEAATRSKKRKDSWLDVSSHNVGLPALEIRRPESTGYLTKMGRQRKVWKKRYCVLKDACIYYYKLMTSHSAQGVAHLHGYVVDETGLSGKRYSFILRPPEQGMRTFYFCAENETDKARWVDAMRKSIQRWVKVDN